MKTRQMDRRVKAHGHAVPMQPLRPRLRGRAAVRPNPVSALTEMDLLNGAYESPSRRRVRSRS